MPKKPSKKTLKKTAWMWFAKYIKLRDSVDGWCTCCTCGKKMRWDSRECNAGHFVCSRNNTVLFDEILVHAQCAKCNCAGGGEEYKYAQFMKRKYGYDDATIEELLSRKFMTKKLTEADLVSIRDLYKQAVEDICL